MVSASVAFLSEGIAFLEGWGILFSDWAHFLLCGISLILCLSYSLFARFCFGVKTSWLFLSLFSVLGIGNLVALILFPEVTDVTVTFASYEPQDIHYVLTNVARARYAVSFFVSCFYFYLLWAVAPKCMRSSKIVLPYLYGILAACVALIVVSLVKEWDGYVAYFTENGTSGRVILFESFTNNRNTFAAILLFGVFSLGYLQCQRHRWIHYVFMAVFSFEILIIMSKTSLFILAGFLLFFVVYRFIKTVRAHPLRSSLLFGGFWTACGVLAAVWSILAITDSSSFFAKITNLFSDALFGAEYSSFDARIDIWKHLFSMFTAPLRIIFGLGEENMQWYLGTGENFNVPVYGIVHSGYLWQFGAGGVIRSAIYLFLLGYALFVFIFDLIHKKKGTLVLLVGFLGMMVHGLTENTSFLETDGKGVLLLLTFVLPILIDRESVLRPAAPYGQVATAHGDDKYSPRAAFLTVVLPLAFAALVFAARAFEWACSPFLVGFGVTFLSFIILSVLTCVWKKEAILHDFLPVGISLSLLCALSMAFSLLLPTDQKVSNIVLLLSFELTAYFAMLTFFPLSRNRFFSHLIIQESFELFVEKRLAKRKEKTDRAEARYFSRNGKPKGKRALPSRIS